MKSEKIYSIEKLMDIADGDIEFLSELIETFQIIINEALEDIKRSIETEDWKSLLRILHKIKPSLIDLNVYSAVDEINIVERKNVTSYQEVSGNLEKIYKELEILNSQIRNNE